MMSKANEKKPDGRRISKKLKPKQRKFIAHYTDPTNKETFGNGTRSAIAAGYTEKAARVAAHQVLTSTNVQHEIQRVLDAAGATEERCAQRLKEGLDAKQTHVFCQDGKVIYSQELPDNQERRLTAVEVLKLLGRYPTNRTVERLELLRIQSALIVVPAIEPAEERRERPARQLTD